MSGSGASMIQRGTSTSIPPTRSRARSGRLCRRVAAVEALLLGLSIGLAAGISPGPLLFLVITSALRDGWRAGALAACAPLVTDLAVVALTLVVLSHLPHQALAALGVVGGLFVVWMGIQTLREAPSASLDSTGATALPPHALRRAATVNILSPHPWVSWSTALGPLTVRTWRGSELGAVALVAGFYVMLIGAKVAVAVLAGSSSHRLSERGYRAALRGAALLLAAAGVALVAEFLPQLV